jgi:hypothetical protein
MSRKCVPDQVHGQVYYGSVWLRTI